MAGGISAAASRTLCNGPVAKAAAEMDGKEMIAHSQSNGFSIFRVATCFAAVIETGPTISPFALTYASRPFVINAVDAEA